MSKNRRRIKLKKEIIATLKEGGEPLSAEAIIARLGKRLKANYLPKSSNALGQLMRQVKGVSKKSANLTSGIGNNYVSAVYYLEDEEAFNEWLEKVDC
jgi:hypothetical protein